MQPRNLAVLAVLAVTLPLAACASAPAAKVSASAAAVTLAVGEASPTEVAETADARVGDVVETDADGRAELVYADGSLARLGPATSLRLEEVSGAEDQRTVMSLDVGRTWHRVVELVAEDAAYEVRTPVGTAAVTGTEFSVECTDEPVCRIVVFDGSVLFTTEDGEELPLEPFSQLTVPGPDGDDPVVLPYLADAVEGDDWLAENFPSAEAATVPAASASFAGEWTALFEGVGSTDPVRAADIAGSALEREWTIAPPVCDPACVSAVESSSGANLQLIHGASELRISGTGREVCVDSLTGEVRDPDGFDYAFDYTLEGIEVGDDGVVTSVTGVRTETFTLRADADAACLEGGVETPVATDTYNVTLTR
ncbi:MAG: hypothetical protein JWP66_1130 [Naasia sp.]|nr:hypothetical protein [Naasia sp.]